MSWHCGFMLETNCGGGWNVALLAKRTYTISAGAVQCADEQLPLNREDRYGAATSASFAPLLAGSDFTGAKSSTDVIVLGSAWAPRGKQVYYLDCSVEVGRAYAKRVRVFGKRQLLRGIFGTWRFSHPQPFTHLQLDYCNCYGGQAFDRYGVVYTHPANPSGCGFALRRGKGAHHELVVPLQEDPAHPLEASALRLHHFEHWQHMPAPTSLGWVAPSVYPRATFWGIEPQLQSVATNKGVVCDPRAWQAASTGLWGKRLLGNEPVRLRYFDADTPEFCFSLPAESPSLRLDTGSGPQAACAPQLETVSIDMEHKLLTMLWRARTERAVLVDSTDIRKFTIACAH